MGEEQSHYKTGNPEVDDAIEMMGRGYAAVTITPPVIKIAMGEEPGFIQTKTPAFVKMSTAFKGHMKKLKGAKLSIWLYIALSINENSTAYPGIETIMRDTGYSNREVIDSIKEITELGYLTVRRRSGTSSLYRIADFVAIGKGNNPTSEVTSPVKKTTEAVKLSALTHDETSLKQDINKREEPELIKQTFQKNSTDSLGKHLDLLAEGCAKNTPYVDVIERLSAGLHLNLPPYGESKDVDHVAHMIALAEANHPDQTVELFCAWATANKDAKELAWYRIKPGGIWGDWLLPYVPVKQKPKLKSKTRDADFWKKLAEA